MALNNKIKDVKRKSNFYTFAASNINIIMDVRAEIKSTINDFLIDEFELDKEDLVETAQLKDDLDIESLDFVDIAVIVEKEFGFKVANEEMINVRTLGDLYVYVQTKVDAK